jgi:hypothetical protein
MASELISFRLSNSELDWLRGQCQPGESLNLAAKRLLLSISQGVDTPVNSLVDTVDTSVDSVDTHEVREELKELQTRLDERFEELEQRLGKLNA